MADRHTVTAAVERERTRKVARIGNQLAVTRLSTAAIRVLEGLARGLGFLRKRGWWSFGKLPAPTPLTPRVASLPDTWP